MWKHFKVLYIAVLAFKTVYHSVDLCCIQCLIYSLSYIVPIH